LQHRLSVIFGLLFTGQQETKTLDISAAEDSVCLWVRKSLEGSTSIDPWNCKKTCPQNVKIPLSFETASYS
jgi:predicted aldo/keto reductase-like oxidoreductase